MVLFAISEIILEGTIWGMKKTFNAGYYSIYGPTKSNDEQILEKVMELKEISHDEEEKNNKITEIMEIQLENQRKIIEKFEDNNKIIRSAEFTTRNISENILTLYEKLDKISNKIDSLQQNVDELKQQVQQQSKNYEI